MISFGIEESDLGALRKALDVGYGVSPETETGFGATRLQSLAKTMKYATEKEKASKFFLQINKSKAESTVEEFTSVNKIGRANFYVEGGLPDEWDEDITREYECVKYIGAVGKVPNVANSVKSLVNNTTLIQNLKAIAIIRTIDYKAFFANSANISTEFNGFLAQFNNRVNNPSQNIIDLRGNCITPSILNQIGATIEGNYGDPMNLKGWIPISAFQNYANYVIQNKTYMIGNNEIRDITAVPKKWELANGSGNLETDLHLKSKGETNTDNPYPFMNSNNTAFAPMSSDSPNTLNALTAVVTVVTDPSPVPLLTPGTYDYCFLPVSAWGAGAGFEVKGIVIGASQKVQAVLSDNGSPAGYQASAFEVYRKLSSNTALTSYQYVETTPAGSTYFDDGSEIPGTNYSFFWDWDFDQVLDIRQLLPMVKQPLAIIDDSIRWLQKWYGTPILYNPNKMVVLKNVGSNLNC